MRRLVFPAALALWVGTALLLSRVRWFARAPLAERVDPGRGGRHGVLSGASFRDVIGPLVTDAGSRLARIFGVQEELAVRLERMHAATDVTAFRTRQAAWSLAGLAVGAMVGLALSPPGIVSVLLVLGGPLLAFLILEQQVVAASARWQRRVFLELPVVVEQLAMLLSSGFSLGAALNRLADRGTGACAHDLRRVCGRIRQGLSEREALREWAGLVALPAVGRLTTVLALERDATDLGPLLTEEARAIRRDVHRQLIETIERRSQQVWIPVTVATLLPGVILMAIPFVEALRAFSGGR
jgi:tight adherence protein C